MTRYELIELGAPKMEGQFLALGPMSYFTKKTPSLIQYVFLAN
jgi:hypothetical protein